MQIVLNTDEALSDLDKEILGLVLGGDVTPAAKPPATRTRAAAKPAPEPEPEPEPEDLMGAAVTMDDVVARATEIINAKKQADLKRVLTGFDVKKVGELKPKDFAAFLEDCASIETD